MKTDEILEQLSHISEEQLSWNRPVGTIHLKTVFDMEFKFNSEKIVYEISDEEKSSRELEKETRGNRSKILLLWHKWHNIGTASKSQKYESRRMKKPFSLTDVGIEIEFPSKNQSKQNPKGDYE